MTLRKFLKLMYFPRKFGNSKAFCPLFCIQTYIKKFFCFSSVSSYDQIFFISTNEIVASLGTSNVACFKIRETDTQ